jgi:CheY-like chemotaxis protein
MSEPESTVVLVVDDEPMLRMSAVDDLEEDGFKAIEAADATEALDQLDRHPEISVLFTDIQMPGRNGLELARIVLARWPNIRLIVTSGRLTPAEVDIPDDGRFVPKPYGKHAVRDALIDMDA